MERLHEQKVRKRKGKQHLSLSLFLSLPFRSSTTLLLRSSTTLLLRSSTSLLSRGSTSLSSPEHDRDDYSSSRDNYSRSGRGEFHDRHRRSTHGAVHLWRAKFRSSDCRARVPTSRDVGTRVTPWNFAVRGVPRVPTEVGSVRLMAIALDSSHHAGLSPICQIGDKSAWCEESSAAFGNNTVPHRAYQEGSQP